MIFLNFRPFFRISRFLEFWILTPSESCLLNPSELRNFYFVNSDEALRILKSSGAFWIKNRFFKVFRSHWISENSQNRFRSHFVTASEFWIMKLEFRIGLLKIHLNFSNFFKIKFFLKSVFSNLWSLRSIATNFFFNFKKIFKNFPRSATYPHSFRNLFRVQKYINIE